MTALTRRSLFALLVALTLAFQTTLAERHFEPIVGTGPIKVMAGGDAVPTSGEPDTDCALCQFLSLGIATDVPHDSIDWLRAAIEDTPLVVFEHTRPREQLRGSHRARAPPSPSIA